MALRVDAKSSTESPRQASRDIHRCGKKQCKISKIGPIFACIFPGVVGTLITHCVSRGKNYEPNTV